MSLFGNGNGNQTAAANYLVEAAGLAYDVECVSRAVLVVRIDDDGRIAELAGIVETGAADALARLTAFLDAGRLAIGIFAVSAPVAGVVQWLIALPFAKHADSPMVVEFLSVLVEFGVRYAEAFGYRTVHPENANRN